MTKTGKNFTTFVAIALLWGCGANSPGHPDDSSIEAGIYHNSFFGLRFPIPEGWAIASDETEKRLKETGKEVISGDNKVLDAALEAAEKSTYQLLMVSEHPMGTPVVFNSNLILVAEVVSHAPGVRTGEDYLFHTHNLLQQAAISYERIVEPEPIQIGGRKFFRAVYEVEINSVTFHQTYVVTIDRGFALAFILSGADNDMDEQLLSFAKKLQFH